MYFHYGKAETDYLAARDPVLGAAIDRLLRENGCTADPDRPVMERYTPAGAQDGICEFCIPIL